VTTRVFEVEAASAASFGDLAGPAASRIRPVGKCALPDATEDRVELVLTDPERIVEWPDVAVGVREVEAEVVVRSVRR
jgi:hypothetical protein